MFTKPKSVPANQPGQEIMSPTGTTPPSPMPLKKHPWAIRRQNQLIKEKVDTDHVTQFTMDDVDTDPQVEKRGKIQNRR